MATTPLLELRNIHVAVDQDGRAMPILHDVSLAFERGRTHAIIGPSGSGKTTLLMVCAGLQALTRGTMLFEGKALPHDDEDALTAWRRQSVGIVFQHFHLLPTSTALENVMLPLELARHDAPRDEAETLLRSVGLGPRLHPYPSQLSGGEQQRVALVRALSCRPALLLADEPTGNLDQHTGQHVMDVLFDQARAHGTTLVLITHDADLASRCDVRIHLSDGQVTQDA